MVLKTRSADWLRDDYYRSIRRLAQMGVRSGDIGVTERSGDFLVLNP